MIETLKINKERGSIMFFQEVMHVSGEWIKYEGTGKDSNSVRFMDYGTTKYDYYVHERDDGEHTIFRNKK